MASLGESIRARRDELDYSLREFAAKVGISAPFLSDIELGRRYPSDDILKKIAKELKVSYGELKQLDQRVPLREIKNVLDSNPKLGVVFREIAEKPDEFLEWAKRKDDEIKKD